MQKFSFLFAAMMLTTLSLQAQKYFTREGKVSFFSDTPMEKIEAHNQQATAVVDLSNGNIEFAVLIKAFRF